MGLLVMGLLVFIQILGINIHGLLDPEMTDKSLFTYLTKPSIKRMMFLFPIPFNQGWYVKQGYTLNAEIEKKIKTRNLFIFLFIASFAAIFIFP